ncbi:Lys-63-specific deubiquitinase BRCC36 [Zostera marina]|uniref:Lys-63-specific deubiquitinase BRCC36 n=1 Tax=Zostera marina TaxID=29655 RepID=A0A0K9PTF7_ZOSMR|nr:Lys-63-specific deubiquitinase BRCC36 [Zostera marina]
MSLTSVKMSEEVWLTCVSHALTMETEEIMGLLLGDTKHTKNGNEIAVIWGASPQMRSDRRKDRVETNPELLAAASAQADRMTLETGITTRVIGWYHSHPHITVLPSHVDVRTQAMYQLLDPGFIGLIFSCYSEDAQKVGRIQVIAFQSLDGRQRNTGPSTNSSIIDIETTLGNSNSSVSASSLNILPEENAGDSHVTNFAKVGGNSSDFGDINNHEKEKAKGKSMVPYIIDDVKNSTELSDGMQEALHRSNMEMSGAEYIRKEVPLHILPTSCLLKLENPLKSLIDMQYMLFEEEQSAYSHAISHSTCDGKIHPLSFIHHTSTYQASLCKLMEYCLTPAINALQDRQKENKMRLSMLIDEVKQLETEAAPREDSTERLIDQAHYDNPTIDQRDMLLASNLNKNNVTARQE